MFGVIPRPLWEKKMQPDARNRITLSMNCFLIQAGGKRILVETGAGDKMSAKVREIYGLDGPFLEDELRGYGLRPEDIDIVLNTHLHFDHCGGNTRVEKDKVVPVFPNARYIVQRGEFEHGVNPSERDRASYFPENFAPIEAAGKYSLLDGDGEIAPGVEVICLPGHTAHMQGVKLTGGGKTAFLFADLVPTTAHLPIPWIMGYDLYPMTTLENKKRWIPEVVREGWLALFAHDARIPAAHLRERDGQWDAEPAAVD
jgi:glyoxylase-like metal-dependent hydrolase (beta-lactamase superfamily II)